MSDFVDVEFDFPTGKVTSSVHKESLAAWEALGWRQVDAPEAPAEEVVELPDSEQSESD